MNGFRKVYYVCRYLGPRFVAVRVKLLLDKRLGRTRRVFASRDWDDIDLREIAVSGTPSDAEGYAAFKRGQAIPFLFPLGRPPEIAESMRNGGLARESLRRPELHERVKLLAEGRCVYFLQRTSPAAIDWYVNPFDGTRGRSGVPWYDIADFEPEQGDGRMLWEASRGAWAIDLARAGKGASHEASEPPFQGRLRHEEAEIYWRWVESWMEACRPWEGFQWKCGQEASVRMIALALSFWAFADDRATTAERWVRFARLAWATGYRVFHHLGYAVSQKNNHALSEACGLMLAAHLFPEFREAARWGETGRAVFARELRRQIYDDGSYVQHSMNYHRVMLDVSLAAFRLAELAGRPFERDHYERVGRAGAFLYQMTDADTGRAPNYGNNDGAYVLPLSECGFGDYRPVMQAVHYLVHRKRLFPSGPWDEELVWLFGEDVTSHGATEPRNREEALPFGLPPWSPSVPHPKGWGTRDGTSVPHSKGLGTRESRAFEAGGYYTLRRGESWAMVRCHTYRDRPGQCDPLHVDLWWRGVNVLRDCGTFRYYVPGRPDVEEYSSSLAAHNTLEIDGAEPYERTSRFLWFPWPRAEVRRFETGGEAPRFEGERYDYDRRPWRVVHRRAVIARSDDLWEIEDELISTGDGEHTSVMRWHFCDAPFEVDASRAAMALRTEKGVVRVGVDVGCSTLRRFEVIRGRDEPGRVQGFAADVYGERIAIPTLEVEVSGGFPIRVVTRIELG